jgi:hypothetical protein
MTDSFSFQSFVGDNNQVWEIESKLHNSNLYQLMAHISIR